MRSTYSYVAAATTPLDGRPIAASEEGSQDERTQAAFFIVEARRTELEEIARLIDDGEVRPIVAATFPLADALLAYRHKPAWRPTFTQPIKERRNRRQRAR